MCGSIHTRRRIWYRGRLAKRAAVNPQMAEEQPEDSEVDRFIHEEIDSVPHLEALLLIWISRPKEWSADELAKRLYLDNSAAGRILGDLVGRELIATAQGNPKHFRYEPGERDRLFSALEAAYRGDLIRISTMIHRKASPAVLEFARAFRFTKE